MHSLVPGFTCPAAQYLSVLPAVVPIPVLRYVLPYSGTMVYRPPLKNTCDFSVSGKATPTRGLNAVRAGDSRKSSSCAIAVAVSSKRARCVLGSIGEAAQPARP